MFLLEVLHYLTANIPSAPYIPKLTVVPHVVRPVLRKVLFMVQTMCYGVIVECTILNTKKQERKLTYGKQSFRNEEGIGRGTERDL